MPKGETMGDKRRGIFWGWYVVLGAFLIIGINYGARYSFGVFVNPMTAEYGWSRSIISGAISIMVLTYGAGSILAGRLVDRIAPRWIITAGAVLMAAGMFLTAMIRSPWQFYFTYGILGGLGAACLGVVVCNSSVGKWFIRKRGLAFGISSVGVGAGTMAMAPLAGYFVKVYGWRSGFILMGACVLVIGVVLSQWLMGKTRPEDYGLLPDGGGETERVDDPIPDGGPRLGPSLKQVLRDPRFWVLAVCYSLAVSAEMSSLIHQVAHAQDLRIDKVTAASSLGMIGMAGSLGRFFFGWVSDRIRDAKYPAAMGFLLMAAGMFLLVKTTSVAMLFAYALLFGFGLGSVATMMPFLLADRFGRQVLGSAYGVLTFLSAGIGGGAGPLIAGYIYDWTGSYNGAWLLNLTILVIVTFLILSLKPRRPDVTA
jgi:sugar phosphate permease